MAYCCNVQRKEILVRQGVNEPGRSIPHRPCPFDSRRAKHGDMRYDTSECEIAVHGLENIDRMFKVVVRVLGTINQPQVAQERTHFANYADSINLSRVKAARDNTHTDRYRWPP